MGRDLADPDRYTVGYALSRLLYCRDHRVEGSIPFSDTVAGRTCTQCGKDIFKVYAVQMGLWND